VYGSNIHQSGSDPRVRTYDLGSDPLDHCDFRMTMVQDLRSKILTDLVKDNEGWGRARQIYGSLLNNHLRAVSTAAAWVGGSLFSNAYKGDPNAVAPVENIPAAEQRRALQFVIDHTFLDEAFGLTPELIAHLSVDKGYDGGYSGANGVDPAYNVHDTIAGIQASALTMLMNPSTLRRLYDNEFRAASAEDSITMAEVVSSVGEAVWTELEASPARRHSASDPFISSLRRNLQAEHVDRLIGMAQRGSMSGAAARPLNALCRAELRELKGEIDGALTRGGANFDPYTLTHLSDLSIRIERALEAQQVYGS
jgi:hypothetical protein